MILVDTSVLIDYFRGNNNTCTDKFQYILENNIEFGISNLIYLELLQGSKNDREYHLLKKYLKDQKFYGIKDGKRSYEEASLVFIKARKKGHTIRSSIDLIISRIAIENELYLLHNDKDFKIIADLQNDLKIL